MEVPRLELTVDANIVVSSGIWAGMKTVKYFEGKTYTWVGISKQPTLRQKVSIRFELPRSLQNLPFFLFPLFSFFL